MPVNLEPSHWDTYTTCFLGLLLLPFGYAKPPLVHMHQPRLYKPNLLSVCSLYSSESAALHTDVLHRLPLSAGYRIVLHGGCFEQLASNHSCPRELF